MPQRGSPPTPTEPVFIGFTGRIGAGKTSAAEYLRARYGFQYTRYSRVLSEWLSSGSTDRRRLQELGWNIMSGGLQVELNSRLIAGLDRSRSAAIDGLRHPTDFDTLSSAFAPSFHMIFLEAGRERRFERLRSRFPTYVAFSDADSQPVEGCIDGLKLLASLAISNEGSLGSLYQQLDVGVATWGVGELA